MLAVDGHTLFCLAVMLQFVRKSYFILDNFNRSNNLIIHFDILTKN